MLTDDLVEVARSLTEFGRNKPKQAYLRRAISTAYYAMFHTLTKCCADSLLGTSKSNRSNEAWLQAYRAMNHGDAKTSCGKNVIKKFPVEIQDFASVFVQMQQKRHEADYNPNEKFLKSSVVVDINLVEASIKKFKLVSLKDKRAFAILVLLKQRTS